jgi:hypothetical protein
MLVLSQFVLRLSFGLALAMGLTSPRKVTSGFFRNHSYVLLGLCVVAVLAAFAGSVPSTSRSSDSSVIKYETPRQQAPAHLVRWPPLVAAALSYCCAASWLYEKPTLGRALLFAVSATSLLGAWISQPMPFFESGHAPTPWAHITLYVTTVKAPLELPLLLWRLDPVGGGMLLGSTIAAMFLGHWYLNTPTMELEPLRKLLCFMAVAVALRALLAALCLGIELQQPWLSPSQYPLLALHWLAGIIGTGVLAWMAWQTLKIPNTQSATGILYVAVITVFIGELTSLLLSGGTAFPV